MKTSQLAFHPAFADDLAEAALSLQEEAGLGEELVAEYELTLRRVVQNPELYQVRSAGVRRANLDRFSYSVRYVWDGGCLYVLAFPHHHRATSYWLRRLADLGDS